MKKVFICLICSTIAFTSISCSKINDSNDQNSMSTEDTKQEANYEEVEDKNLDDEAIKYYDDIVDSYNKKYKEGNKINVSAFIKNAINDTVDEEKVNKNKEILKDLHTKSKIREDKGIFITEKNNYSDKEKIINVYLKDGNFRKEEFLDGKGNFLSIYNKDDDVFYLYNLEGKTPESYKTEEYSKKVKGTILYKHGYFVNPKETLSILYVADIKEIDFEGKKVMYSRAELENIDIEHWIDKETGFLIKTVETIKGDSPSQIISTFTYDTEKDISEDLFKIDEESIKNQFK